MHSRSFVVVALAVVWLCTMALANIEFGEPIAPQNPKKLPAFSHRDHVLHDWAGTSGQPPEVFRDCRGCHQFSDQNRVSAPQEHCSKCHFGTGALDAAFSPGSKERLNDFASRTRSAFRHHTHGMMECRECHAIDGGLMKSSIPLQTGPGECARCHEATQARKALDDIRWYVPASKDAELARACGLPDKFTIPTDLDAYAKRLDAAFAGDGTGINALLESGGDFTHGDHNDLDCKSCHKGIESATANAIGTGSIEATGCGDCHQRAGGEPARFGEAIREQRPSWSLGAFDHADHFRVDQTDGVCTPEAYGLINSKTCQPCHTYAPEREGFAGRDYPFNGDSSRHRYQDCQQCHAVAGWSTGESPADPSKPPLHGSTSASQVSGWNGEQQKCTACHAFGEPDMAGNRPELDVARWSDKTFEFVGQTHPFITTSEAGDPAVQQDCSKCHRAVVPSLPSRLIERRFAHATHLPSAGTDLTAKDCTGCHPSAAKAGDTAALAVDFRTYDLGSCSTCHRGSEIREQVGEQKQPTPRAVVAFPHGPHVAANLACTACHDRGAENMTTKPAALACNECHNHIAGDDGPVTEYLFGDEVKSCAKCHDGAAGEGVNVPAIRGSDAAANDSRYGIVQELFAGFADRQFHPSSSRCTTCHRANVKDGLVQPIKARRANFLFARKTGNFHDAKDQKKEKLQQDLLNKAPGCMSCHWRDNGNLSEWRFNPESRTERDRLGNQFANFPGLKSKG